MKKENSNLKKPKAMKTMKIFAAAILALVVIGAAAMKPANVNAVGSNISSGNIKYVVTIHAPTDLAIPAVHFIVLLTDGNGRRIAYQQAVPGMTKYQFSEIGPVTGTRIVKLVEMHISDVYLNFSCAPDVKTGTFQNGVVYNFNLYPSVALPQ
jgi:hypothetical protein